MISNIIDGVVTKKRSSNQEKIKINMHTVVIVDYGSGNLRSVAKAFERATLSSSCNSTVLVSAKPEDVSKADRVVLPGVGAFGDCLRGLELIPGLIESITDATIRKGRPFLGICVGMQLMATISREHGIHRGLDWIQGEVIPINPFIRVPPLKVPHMGWNELQFLDKTNPLFSDLQDKSHVYFVHSYHFVVVNPKYCLATTDYGGSITAMVHRNNLVGTQFHPEKSQTIGLTLIANFLRWSP